jgi:hypothetical protein
MTERDLGDAPREIIVTAETSPGREYQILGQVEWPTPDMFVLFRSPCNVRVLRDRALVEYGSDLDAVIGYHEWTEDRQVHCGGTAIRFVGEER